MYFAVIILSFFIVYGNGRLVEDVEDSVLKYATSLVEKLNDDIINSDQSFLINWDELIAFDMENIYNFTYREPSILGLNNGTTFNIISSDISDNYYNFTLTFQYNILEINASINIGTNINGSLYEGYGEWIMEDFKRYINIVITKSSDEKYISQGADITMFPSSQFVTRVHIPDAPQCLKDWASSQWLGKVGFYTIPQLNTWMISIFDEELLNTDPSSYFNTD